MPVSDWAPTVAAVGALLRARTKDRNGNELGTFTDTTRPTANQVAEILSAEVADLADTITTNLRTEPTVPVEIPQRLWATATRVAALAAACAIELGYFPEQVATGRSPYTQLKELLDERRKSFLNALRDAGYSTDGDDTTGGASDAPVAPSGGFPIPTVRFLEPGYVRSPGSSVPIPQPVPGEPLYGVPITPDPNNPYGPPTAW